MTQYIHYGHKAYDPNLFSEVKNRVGSNKPSGGLWASAVDAEYGWKAWNKDEDFVVCDDDNAFKFELTQNVKVFVIDSVAKADALPKTHLSGESDRWAFLASTLGFESYDFEKLARVCDAIDFRLSDDHKLYYKMYGWDCDSILVLNKECIVPLS